MKLNPRRWTIFAWLQINKQLTKHALHNSLTHAWASNPIHLFRMQNLLWRNHCTIMDSGGMNMVQYTRIFHVLHSLNHLFRTLETHKTVWEGVKWLWLSSRCGVCTDSKRDTVHTFIQCVRLNEDDELNWVFEY